MRQRSGWRVDYALHRSQVCATAMLRPSANYAPCLLKHLEFCSTCSKCEFEQQKHACHVGRWSCTKPNLEGQLVILQACGVATCTCSRAMPRSHSDQTDSLSVSTDHLRHAGLNTAPWLLRRCLSIAVMLCRLSIDRAFLLRSACGGARHFIAYALALVTAGRSEDTMALTSSSSSSSNSSPLPSHSTEVEAFWRQLLDACRQSVAGRNIEHRASVASDEFAIDSTADA